MPRPSRLLWILIIASLAAALFTVARLKRDYVDFAVYQTAGRRALAGEPLYRPDDQHYQFKYLPAFALAMVPFAPLNPEVAKPIWFALSVGLLLAFVTRSVAALPDRRAGVGWLTAIAALLITKFVVKELVNGQTNLLLGWILVSALAAAQHQRRILTGVLVGLAVFVKPYAILLIPWVLLTAGLPALAATGLVIGAGLVVPAAVYGWSGNVQLLVDWFHTVTATTPENLLFGENISVATMWAKWLGPGPAASLLAGATAVAAVATAAVVCAWRRRVREPNYLEVSMLLWLIPVLSPQGWDYVLLVGTPALVLLIDRWSELAAGWRAVFVVSVLATSFTAYDTLGRALYLHVLDSSIITVAVLALAAMLADLRRRALA